jgi:hypothetical protein
MYTCTFQAHMQIRSFDIDVTPIIGEQYAAPLLSIEVLLLSRILLTLTFQVELYHCAPAHMGPHAVQLHQQQQQNKEAADAYKGRVGLE